MDIVILTDHRYVKPPTVTNYNRNVLYEDDLVLKALEKQCEALMPKDYWDSL